MDKLSQEDKQILLNLARAALEDGVRHVEIKPLDLKIYSPILMAYGASFVTLTIRAELRGCIGALQAYQPLAEDVREHAVAAATEDYRFQQVQVKD